MNFIRLYSSPVTFIWIILLSISLLVTQNLQFHVHGLDHDTVLYDSHDTGGIIDAEHQHLAVKHLSIDTSHADHHDMVVVEMDASPDGIMKQSSTSAPLLALLTLFVLLSVLAGYFPYRPAIRPKVDVVPRWRFHLIPLLRAPPANSALYRYHR